MAHGWAHREPIRKPRLIAAATVAAVVAALGLASCARQSITHPTSSGRSAVHTGSTGPVAMVSTAAPVTLSPYTKIMVIVEENKPRSAIFGSGQAPYLSRVAAVHGEATNMVANFPVACPSLGGYIIMTSGSRQNICDDLSPVNHPLSVDNIFRQVAAAGKQWKAYSESMTANCQRVDGAAGGFLVRHTPPPYYTSEAGRCLTRSVPLGTTTSGNLHTDLVRGLPDYSFVTPNACNDMHAATTCPTNPVLRGDAWLARWLPQIASSPDYLQSRLVVVITWDEGSRSDNHIPTLIVGHTVRYGKSAAKYTHCSTLRLAEELLGLPFLGCAASAPSFRAGFHF